MRGKFSTVITLAVQLYALNCVQSAPFEQTKKTVRRSYSHLELLLRYSDARQN